MKRLIIVACAIVVITVTTTFAVPQTQPGPSPAAPTSTANQPTLRLHMPDGQLKSHSIRVYVTGEILPSQAPRLRLLRSHAVTKKDVDEAALWEPGVVAPGQEWIEDVDGQQVRRSGTLLLFDISNISFGGKAMLRVMPVLSWTNGSTVRLLVGESEVNIGNIVAAIGWTLLVVGAALLVAILLARRSGGRALLYLTGVDGHLHSRRPRLHAGRSPWEAWSLAMVWFGCRSRRFRPRFWY
jgi:hypothetical protein